MIAEPRPSLIPWLLRRPYLYRWVSRAVVRSLTNRLSRRDSARSMAATEVRVLRFDDAIQPRLQGEAVRLRPLVRRDVTALRTLTFRDVMQAYDRCHVLWAVVEKQSEAVVGYCGLTPLAINGESMVELGYSIIPEFRRRGYATEAACLAANDAFERLRLTRLIAIVEPNNVMSIKVLKKADFEFWQPGSFFSTPVHIY